MAERFLVLGCGSIGKRHIRNLMVLGENDIIAYDPQGGCLKEVQNQFDIPVVDNLELAWKQSPDVAFITAPTSQHLPLALEALRHGCHIFIEKPLSHSWDQIPEFLRLCSLSKTVVQVAANMRYHPGPRMLKRLVDQGLLGRLFAVSTLYGGYLPDWHPGEDYRKSYSARRDLGGGVILDCIHEIDMALWFLEEPVSVVSATANTGFLEIETEDIARILICDKNGAIATVEIDYLQKPTQRRYAAIGEKGRLEWNIHLPYLLAYFRDGKEQRIDFCGEKPTDVNGPYLEQTRDFLECVRKGLKPSVTVQDGAKALAVALAAKNASPLPLEAFF